MRPCSAHSPAQASMFFSSRWRKKARTVPTFRSRSCAAGAAQAPVAQTRRAPMSRFKACSLEATMVLLSDEMSPEVLRDHIGRRANRLEPVVEVEVIADCPVEAEESPHSGIVPEPVQ